MPWAKSVTSDARAPARSNTASIAASTPSDWSAGVVGALAVTTRPPATSTASVNVPPTSTPRSTGRRYRPVLVRSELGRDQFCLFRLSEMLMRRAVAVVRQRVALAGGAATRRRAALHRVAARVVALARLAGQPLVGGGQIRRDHAEDAGLGAHREMHADVVEERPCGPGKVMPIRHQPLDRLLAGLENGFVPVAPRIAIDLVSELPIDGPAELIHACLNPPRGDPAGPHSLAPTCEVQNDGNVELSLRTGAKVAGVCFREVLIPRLERGNPVRSDDGVAPVESRIAGWEVLAAVTAAGLGAQKCAGRDLADKRMFII